MDFNADLFENVKRLAFSSSTVKAAIFAFYGRSLSIFKYISVNGVNPGSNGAALKIWFEVVFLCFINFSVDW